MGPFNRREVEDDGLAPEINDTSPEYAPVAATHSPDAGIYRTAGEGSQERSAYGSYQLD
jgi:hypothetical protein